MKYIYSQHFFPLCRHLFPLCRHLTADAMQCCLRIWRKQGIFGTAFALRVDELDGTSELNLWNKAAALHHIGRQIESVGVIRGSAFLFFAIMF